MDAEFGASDLRPEIRGCSPAAKLGNTFYVLIADKVKHPNTAKHPERRFSFLNFFGQNSITARKTGCTK